MTKLISNDEVLKLAALSSLRLPEKEVVSVAQQVQDVLSYAARVGEIAAEVPETRTMRVNIFRDDVVRISCGDAVLADAPEVQEHYFVVPAVLEK